MLKNSLVACAALPILLLLGSSGNSATLADAERHAAGYISAYDAKTGTMAWRFYTMPGDPSMLSAAPADLKFRDGLSAYNGGNYLKALEIWLPLAQHEDAPSQAGVGFIYHRGLGVQVDDQKAYFWLRKAAEHGQPEGQMMLGTLYFYGQGVGQSYVQAYAWCDLALDGGSADAEDCRGAALQSLRSDSDLKQAFQLSTNLHHQFGPKL